MDSVLGHGGNVFESIQEHVWLLSGSQTGGSMYDVSVLFGPQHVSKLGSFRVWVVVGFCMRR